MDIEKPSFDTSKRMSLLSMDNIFQRLYLDQAKGNLCYKTEKIATPKFSTICGGEYDHHDSCVTYNVLDTKLGEYVKKPAKDEKKIFGFASSEVSCESYLQRNITVSKSNPLSNTSCIQNLPSESAVALTLRNKDHAYTYKDDLHGQRTDERGFLAEVVYTCHQGNSYSLVPIHPNSFSALLLDQRQREINGQAIQLDGEYVSSESGYIQSHSAQLNTNESESLVFEEFENIDIDVSVNQTINKESEQQHANTSLAKQSLISPADIEYTEANSVWNNSYAPSSDTDEEVDILVWDEPSTFICQEHKHGYTGNVCPAEVVLSTVGLPPSEDVQGPSNTGVHLISDEAPSDFSFGYITASRGMCNTNQHNNSMHGFTTT